MLGNTSVKVK